MALVSQKQVDALLADIHKEVPEFQICYKDEELPKVWYVILVFAFMKIVGFFAPGFKKRWDENFTVGIGPYVIFPSKKTFGNLREDRVYFVLRHEFQHLLDHKRYGLWFTLSYVFFPLPMFLTYRAHWEFRAYVQSLIAYHEMGIRLDNFILEHITTYFTSGQYFWMFPFKGFLMRRLRNVKRAIQAGDLKAYDDVSLLR